MRFYKKRRKKIGKKIYKKSFNFFFVFFRSKFFLIFFSSSLFYLFHFRVGQHLLAPPPERLFATWGVTGSGEIRIWCCILLFPSLCDLLPSLDITSWWFSCTSLILSYEMFLFMLIDIFLLLKYYRLLKVEIFLYTIVFTL